MTVTDWDHRQLCPDGSCVGVIGPDGTCKACGRAAPGWGDERQRGLLADADDAQAGEAEVVADPDADGGDDGEGDDGDDDDLAPPADWQQRELCSDGACTGVIGDDRRCRVCGKEPG